MPYVENVEKIEKRGYDHYGLPVFLFDGYEYAVAENEKAADEACFSAIEESAWAFNAKFIVEYTKLSYVAFEMVRNFQELKCEDANETILALIENFDTFAYAAIAEDGRGHFLAPYDGHEVCLNEIDSMYWGQILGHLQLKSKDLRKVMLYRL